MLRVFSPMLPPHPFVSRLPFKNFSANAQFVSPLLALVRRLLRPDKGVIPCCPFLRSPNKLRPVPFLFLRWFLTAVGSWFAGNFSFAFHCSLVRYCPPLVAAATSCQTDTHFFCPSGAVFFFFFFFFFFLDVLIFFPFPFFWLGDVSGPTLFFRMYTCKSGVDFPPRG